jgi:benzoate/toluate 1,2-dioxygenase alpha subunit/2,4,5-trichlorophenoxyacetic acid oxygenase 1
MDIDHIRLYVDDRPQEGVFRVHKDAFSDPQVFELEMKYIFERVWNFLGLESQIPKANDFFTTHIGRTPVLVTRDARNNVGAFVNACRHKGATVCRLEQGNSKFHVCPYHGWAYDAAGKNVDIKDRAAGAYAPAFEQENHDLLPVAKVASYRGFIFGSLSSDVPPLEEWLGDMARMLDLSVDQSLQGVEFIPGRAVYTFRSNWKLQLDNALDGYHLTSTHSSFMDLQARRRKGEGHLDAKQYDWSTRSQTEGGMFSFVNGHSCTWGDMPEPAKRPIWGAIDEVRSRVGDTRARWMLGLRQLVLFPNMQINDAAGVILRIIRPLAVDRTEMHSYCLAPIGERPEHRAHRLRQYEDFFNPGGMATPDDTVTYGECQAGFPAKDFTWVIGYSRGMGEMKAGGNERSEELGIKPSASVRGLWNQFNEVGLHHPYREWARLLEAGIAGRKPY